MLFTTKTECTERIIDGVVWVEEITYKVYEDGTEEVACTFCKQKVTEEVIPEPTQLDRIENTLALLTEDTAEYKAFYEAAKEILPEGSDA